MSVKRMRFIGHLPPQAPVALSTSAKRLLRWRLLHGWHHLADPLHTFTRIGVQSQVLTIVNDKTSYYPDLVRGMIIAGKERRPQGNDASRVFDEQRLAGKGNRCDDWQ